MNFDIVNDRSNRATGIAQGFGFFTNSSSEPKRAVVFLFSFFFLTPFVCYYRLQPNILESLL